MDIYVDGPFQPLPKIFVIQFFFFFSITTIFSSLLVFSFNKLFFFPFLSLSLSLSLSLFLSLSLPVCLFTFVHLFYRPLYLSLLLSCFHSFIFLDFSSSFQPPSSSPLFFFPLFPLPFSLSLSLSLSLSIYLSISVSLSLSFYLSVTLLLFVFSTILSLYFINLFSFINFLEIFLSSQPPSSPSPLFFSLYFA